MRSGPSWNTPEAATAFCACSEETMERVSRPSAAIFRVENSRINHFVLRTENVDLADIRHGQNLRANILDLIAQLSLSSRPSLVKA